MRRLTPMMQQYVDVKKEYPDALLFFRLGDFYEMFFEDALVASRELEIALTQRDCGLEEKAPMCGVPHHVSQTYISRLVDKGYKVAICEQVEDPALAKGLVKREIVKIVTPGTIMDDGVLNEKSNNYLVSIYLDDYGVGIAQADNSTGEMMTTQFIGEYHRSESFLLDELGRLNTQEIIINQALSSKTKLMNIIKTKLNPFINVREDVSKENDNSLNKLEGLFKNKKNLFEISSKPYSIVATSMLIEYLKQTQFNSLDHIIDITYYEPESYMLLDIATRTNLELLETVRAKKRSGSLVGILDKTKTAMGARLLKKWLEQPLIKKINIEKRLSMVEFLANDVFFAKELSDILALIYDIERISTRLTNGSSNGKDLSALRQSIKDLPKLKALLKTSSEKELLKIENELDDLSDIYELLFSAISDDPPIALKDGGLIKVGYNSLLDEYRNASREGKKWLAKLEEDEKKKTGIRNLKIGYNRVMGYYIDITKSNIANVPDYFIRKQTLANSERYYTEELKSLEDKITGATDKAIGLEYEIFVQIRDRVKNEISRLQSVSKFISVLDCVLSFATVATANGWTKPQLNLKGDLIIKAGRHPVVEKTLPHNLFIPNDTEMNLRDSMVHIITGPNMAGKSTYMRQIAIITLLAQIGSYVPAEYANIGIVDRIFTRIGASDNLSQGESTFMVEMNEVASILNYSTQNSLLILDEVGRGTSTFDGLSIAWAVIEHISSKIKAKTLFATHYHELTQLEEKHEGIVNYTITAKEQGEDIIFLRKIERGSTNQSFGIQVARLAGINRSIVNRAMDILHEIEGSHRIELGSKENKKATEKQMSFQDLKKEYYLEKVAKIEISELRPIDALNVLAKLQEEASKLKE